MYANGFLEEKRRSPVSFAAVVGLHVAALGAVIVFGTTTFVQQKTGNTIIFDVPLDPDPPPVPPPPPQRQQEEVRQQPTTPTTVRTENPPINQTILAPVTEQRPYQPPVDTGPVRLAVASIPRIPDPVRIAAEVDPRFRAALQPPYPREMETAQLEGSVRVRITIGTDGRVTAIQSLQQTNDSFWRATQRQAMNRWRFRPATLDGQPIVSTMVFTVTFRLPEA